MKEITFSWQLTQGLTKCSAAGKVSSNIFHLNTACGFYYFNTPLIESALLKMWLKVERSSLQFTNCNLLRAKRKEKWTFWGSPFSNTIWLVYVIFRWPDQCPSTQNLLCNTLVLKFNLSTEFFLQVERTFLYAVYTKN